MKITSIENCRFLKAGATIPLNVEPQSDYEITDVGPYRFVMQCRCCGHQDSYSYCNNCGEKLVFEIKGNDFCTGCGVEVPIAFPNPRDKEGVN